jgi:hypothetical protein
MATVAVLGSCASPPNSAPPPPSQTEALASVEINDQSLALPATRLVICNRTTTKQPLFFWTGSDVDVPRHPLDERRYDSVEVQFDDDPLTLTAVSFSFSHLGEQVSGQWSATSGADDPVMLTSLGARCYLLTATLPLPPSEPARLVVVRIKFCC